MIPRVHEVVTAFAFVVRRHRRLSISNATAIARALQQAEVLSAGSPAVEPAALFFAFAETRAAFPGAWRLMAAVLAVRQAQLAGRTLDASRDEPASLCTEVLYKRMGWDEVRHWFGARLHSL